MRRTTAHLVLLVAAMSISAAPVSHGVVAAAAILRSGPSSPNPGSPNDLLDVSVVSRDEVWAVGYYGSDTVTSAALVLHWDGTSWTQVESPNPSSTSNELTGVSAISATDAWAVGSYANDASGALNSLIVHWDGTSWSQVEGPIPPSSFSRLDDVSAVSSDDVWAIGTYKPGEEGQHKFPTLVLHWDGTEWSQVDAPSPPHDQVLGLSAASPEEAWAVGYYERRDEQRGLLLRWDGTSWSKVKSPRSTFSLAGASAISSTDAWAVGCRRSLDGYRIEPQLLRWDGERLAVTDYPTRNVDACLSDVDGNRPRDVWAIGTAGNRVRPLIFHWDGASWSEVRSPHPGRDAHLRAVAVRSAADAWVVGNHGGQTLIFHWDGTRWSRA